MYANFREYLTGEVGGILLPRTRVNRGYDVQGVVCSPTPHVHTKRANVRAMEGYRALEKRRREGAVDRKRAPDDDWRMMAWLEDTVGGVRQQGKTKLEQLLRSVLNELREMEGERESKRPG